MRNTKKVFEISNQVITGTNMFASFILVPYMRTSKVVYRINRFQITIYFAVCEKVNPFKVEQTLKTQFVPLIGFFSVILCYKYTSYRLHPFG